MCVVQRERYTFSMTMKPHDRGTKQLTAKLSSLGCVSKLSAMMVCRSDGLVAMIDLLLMTNLIRNGHIHEG